MSDDLDDLLRRAMKSLDDQVPSGYFEALPGQTLARLDEGSMQTQANDDPTQRVPREPEMPEMREVAAGAPPEEDSGLHDIRSLAQSTKQRLSSRRETQNPPIVDDIAATSGAWKHVALPTPAAMVALPELD